ncbi:hypothetical protein OIE66_40665 [Nonomuraea sp. NBC_01738]|uniref:hypothetical protein n=1 Tax=Nonomuraea sp. NBC_01738 TaxID=2976003 RepID=UPI002E10E6E3|nr:hypothetical protein OIE66_40665 [Nonomuraea sp. NBC_01738]
MTIILPHTRTDQRLAQLRELTAHLDKEATRISRATCALAQPLLAAHERLTLLTREVEDAAGNEALHEDLAALGTTAATLQAALTAAADAHLPHRDHAAAMKNALLDICQRAQAALTQARADLRASQAPPAVHPDRVTPEQRDGWACIRCSRPFQHGEVGILDGTIDFGDGRPWKLWRCPNGVICSAPAAPTQLLQDLAELADSIHALTGASHRAVTDAHTRLGRLVDQITQVTGDHQLTAELAQVWADATWAQVALTQEAATGQPYQESASALLNLLAFAAARAKITLQRHLSQPSVERVLDTLAAYVVDHSLDVGGVHQRNMLLAAILAHRHGVDPGNAIDLARNSTCDDRVRDASAVAERLIKAAQRRADADDYGQAPAEPVTGGQH